MSMKPAHLLILAGGYGKRLAPVVNDVPKPLAPVGDHPFLYLLLKNWKEQGISRFTLLLCHKAMMIEDYLRSAEITTLLTNCQVSTLTEDQPLGTGGAIGNAVQQLQLEGNFLVSNADTWLGTGIQQICTTGASSIAVVRTKNASRYGSVEIDNGYVTAFKEKTDKNLPGWINAGLYNLNASLFHEILISSFSLEFDLFPKLARERLLRATPLDAEIIDIGTPDSYALFLNSSSDQI